MTEETLRETLEAAYAEVEQPAPASAPPEETGGSDKDPAEPVRDTAPTEEPTADKPAAEPSGGKKRGPKGRFVKEETEAPAAEPTAEPTEPPAAESAEEREPEPRVWEKVPESWKPAAREYWAKLPAEVQREVARREKEITSTLQETANKRKLADSFSEAIRPYEAIIRSEGRDPVVAAGELFATATLLRMGTPQQKARLVANMVKNFNIPIDVLDSTLAGEVVPDETSKLQQIIDQRLAPVMKFVDEVQALKKRRENTVETQIDTEIETFAKNPENEFFDDVRETMADLMELASKRGKPLTLKEAYDKAIVLTPEVKSVIDARRKEEADKKRAAASSLPINPPPAATPTGSSNSLRSDIENAFAAVAGR